MKDPAQIQLEDKMAGIVFVAPLAVFLGSIYLYTLGKRVGMLSGQSPNDSAHLPADDSENADESPNPDGDK